jgi:hypothetical protein
MIRKTLLAAALAAGVVSLAQAVPAVVAPSGSYPTAPVYGYPGTTVLVQPAPPAPIFEAVPAPREGFVWSPGHYEWRNGQYVWLPGEWMTARSGFAWEPGHWQQRSDGSWQYLAGHWVERDDLAYNDRGRRGPMGDRDGDGIVNRDDRFPRDPTRY